MALNHEISVSSDVVAVNVSLDEYMTRYAEDHCEWVEGVVVKLSPGEIRHNQTLYYLHQLLSAYFELKPIGVVIGQPFVMRLAAFPNRRREPDLLVVLNTNPHELKPTYLDGAADICIEVVSAESTGRDHGDKFSEYEAGGVGEYWIVDPLRQECRFYRLNADGLYQPIRDDADANYRTPSLPGLVLHVPTLWQDTLPGPAATVLAVQRLLREVP